jgi:hypothetical protein
VCRCRLHLYPRRDCAGRNWKNWTVSGRHGADGGENEVAHLSGTAACLVRENSVKVDFFGSKPSEAQFDCYAANRLKQSSQL